jgi:hypothetical protein
MVQHPDDTVTLQREIYLYMQSLSVIVIHDVKGTEFSAIAQSVAHRGPMSLSSGPLIN